MRMCSDFRMSIYLTRYREPEQGMNPGLVVIVTALDVTETCADNWSMYMKMTVCEY